MARRCCLLLLFFCLSIVRLAISFMHVHSVRSSAAMRAATSSINGLCAVLKPKGQVSRAVVDDVKLVLENGVRLTGVRRPSIKIGHGGTLDPMAEGVMVLGVGTGTKLLQRYLSGSKGYRAVAQLGLATDTLDITGNVVEQRDCSFVKREDLERTLPNFTGEILQVPPMYSAIRKGGKRLYDLAREGIEIERQARPVTVHRLALTEDQQLPHFGLEIECGGGTYVRSLIDDICTKVGAVGCMTELVRTKQAMFTLDHCLKPEDWTFENLLRHIVKCNQLANISEADLVEEPRSSSKNYYSSRGRRS